MALHHYQPTRYYTTIGSHEPAMRIADGDTIVTATLDAAGFDASGMSQSPRGNPQTGPFYVEGAEPGDTLAVHFDRLEPNRDTGWTNVVIAENTVDPDYVRELPARGRVSWDIDRKAGTARLAAEEAGLARLVLPLDPMVGCFGVAPANAQAISTATAGPYGGNMDYRGFRAGATVYLPVFMPGALFHIGDGHATQGDGEIVGTGIETSFEVQFTVRVRKGWPIEWPRGEDAEYIFTAGNARPLDQALQHATTEMLRWLAADYGLDARSASLLLGQCVQYEIGNVFDPAYTVVCKVKKQTLEMLS